MLSGDSAVKRHVLSGASTSLPFVSMSASTLGEDSTLGERLTFAIHKERHRGQNAAENALMQKHPDLFRSRGFISSYVNGRRGKSYPDPRVMKVIADFLHVNFEWLVIGSGPMRKGGRGETPAEEALFIARDWGIREDAWKVAWDRNQDRAAEMTAEEWFDAIRIEAEHLDKKGIPRPESVVAAKDTQRRVRRVKDKIQRQRAAPAPFPEEATPVTQAIPPPRRTASK